MEGQTCNHRKEENQFSITEAEQYGSLLARMSRGTSQRDNLVLSGTCILKPIMGHLGKSQLFDNVDGLEKIAQST